MLSRPMPARVQLDVEDVDYAIRNLRKRHAECLQAGNHEKASYWHGAHDALETIVHCRIDTTSELMELLEQKLNNGTIYNYQ